MFEQMAWKDAYDLWEAGSWRLPGVLSVPAAETIFVDYQQEDSYFYGYDWLSKEEAGQRKETIAKNLAAFYLATPTNKGTTQTAAMLAEARSDEERAAVWIAATAKELQDRGGGQGLSRQAWALHIAALGFLRERCGVWHHAMRRLVPEIMIPRAVLESLACRDAEPVMGLIQMNVLLLKNEYRILRYSSLPEGKEPERETWW